MSPKLLRLYRVVLQPVYGALPTGSSLRSRLRRAYLRSANAPPVWLVVDDGDTVMQVGTPNVATVERYVRAVGTSGRVVVIEADPSNAERLGDFVKARGWTNVTIVNRGAWSSAGTLVLSRSPHAGDHKIAVPGVVMDNDFKPENEQYADVTIEVCTLDQVVTDLGLDTVHYLAVTVNGAELEVLRGAQQVIGRVRRIFSKAHARMADGTPLNRPIAAFLEGNGFSVQVTRGEPAVGANPQWRMRDGDVYAERVS
jgi:FkbM family methyltransferase